LLAAEDVEVNRLILEDLLTAEGARVLFAEHGRQALERLEELGSAAFDAVLMDVQMPVMDGYEAARRIRLIAPGLPVIGLTAHALAEERDRCLAAGMVDRVTKPINPEQVVAAILRWAKPGAAPPACPEGDALEGRLAGDATRRGGGTLGVPTFPGAIDWPTLLARFNGRREFVEKLAASVRQHHTETPAKLRAAARQGDREALTFMAHSLKGISGNLEAHRLHELAKAFEATMRAGEDLAAESVDTLAEALEAVLAELKHPDGHDGER
jgi:CheY-like chemotaxis protein